MNICDQHSRINEYSFILLCWSQMFILRTPPKSRALEGRLTGLDKQRRYLAQHLGESAQPWTGALRRLAAAEATVGSTSIEGYGASIEDTVEILAGRPAAKASEETQRIISAYGQAMDRVAVFAGGPPLGGSPLTHFSPHFPVWPPLPQREARCFCARSR